jgi:predicted nucleic acid-binding protein
VSELYFDSNILIDALNAVPQARLEISRARRRWISRITWIEILAGVPEGAGPATEIFLSRFSVREIDEEIARRAAAIRAERRSIRVPDAIVWASAQTSGRVLVTRNTKDFPARMPGIRVPYTL